MEIIVSVSIIMISLVFILQGYGHIIRLMDSSALSMKFVSLTEEALYQLEEKERPLSEGTIIGNFEETDGFEYSAELTPTEIEALMKVVVTVSETKAPHEKPRSFRTVTFL